MTERTNHAYEARRIIRAADSNNSAEWAHQTGEQKADMLAAAQVHATLALVEQQRIANLIALARGNVALDEEMSFVADEAAARLITMEITPATPISGPDEHVTIRDDIREALGL